MAEKSISKEMTDSWIVIDEQDESDFVLVENENEKKISTNLTNNKQQQQHKKRKWKVIYSLPSTNIQGNVNAANLDSFVMDQHAQLYDKRDLFNSQQQIIKVK